MQKYNIRLANNDFVTVEGSLVKGHKYAPEVTLFVHKAYPNYRGSKNWVVSELRTGLSLTYDNTRKGAIAKVENLDVDKNSMLERIDDVVNRYGAAN